MRGRPDNMGLRKCGVRRVVLANVLLLLHNYFVHSAAIASAPQPSPPLPFDGLLPNSATNGTFDHWEYLIIQGSVAYATEIRNVSYTGQDIITTSNFCSNPVTQITTLSNINNNHKNCKETCENSGKGM